MELIHGHELGKIKSYKEYTHSHEEYKIKLYIE